MLAVSDAFVRRTFRSFFPVNSVSDDVGSLVCDATVARRLN